MATDPTASPADAFFLEVSSTRLRVLTFVNDYAVFQNPNGEDRVEQRKVNAFLFEGKSEIRVEVAPTDEVGQRRLDLALTVTRQEQPDTEREVLRYSYQANPSPLDEDRGKAVVVLRHGLDVRRGLGRWSWQDARPFEPGRDVPAIAALVKKLIDALQRKDAPAVIALMKRKLDEESIATGVDPDATRRSMEQKLDDMMRREVYLAEAAPRLHVLPWCGGRLCDVRADHAEPCVFVAAPPHDLAVDTTVSCIDGEWTFIR